MFLEMWQICTGQQEDIQTYYPWSEQPCTVSGKGFVQPYADSPLDTENVGEHVYLQILNQARDYVYINTPYLIVDDSMVSALTLAAKRGVDVQIITPYRWDKWAIHMTTRSYYRDLVRAGVRVYEYKKGFMHAKTFVCDDRSPPWAPPIWISAVCISTSSAERSYSAVLLSGTSSRIFSPPYRPAAPFWRKAAAAISWCTCFRISSVCLHR